MIAGLNHLTLAVRDIERSFHFYVRTLGLKPLARWRQGAYLAAGDLWLCLSLDDAASPSPDYTHYAFSVPQADFATSVARLRQAGIREWKSNRSEGESLYFLDPDGHRLELHAGRQPSGGLPAATLSGDDFF